MHGISFYICSDSSWHYSSSTYIIGESVNVSDDSFRQTRFVISFLFPIFIFFISMIFPRPPQSFEHYSKAQHETNTNDMNKTRMQCIVKERFSIRWNVPE